MRYTDASIRFAQSVPDSASARRAFADESQLQRQLWSLAGQALDAAPVASAPVLDVDSLNAMIDTQTTRALVLSATGCRRRC